jgi:hypothetical protein
MVQVDIATLSRWPELVSLLTPVDDSISRDPHPLHTGRATRIYWQPLGSNALGALTWTMDQVERD